MKTLEVDDECYATATVAWLATCGPALATGDAPALRLRPMLYSRRWPLLLYNALLNVERLSSSFRSTNATDPPQDRRLMCAVEENSLEKRRSRRHTHGLRAPDRIWDCDSKPRFGTAARLNLHFQSDYRRDTSLSSSFRLLV